MSTRFQVEHVFGVTGRGGVLAGNILEGEIRAGQHTPALSLDGAPRRLEVSGVEFVDHLGTRTARIALVFRESPDIETLRRAVPLGTILELA